MKKCNIMYAIAITGHRPDSLGYSYDYDSEDWYGIRLKIREKLLENLKVYNCLICINGMALGIDQVFGLECLALREEGYNIKILCASPCLYQEKKWKDATVYNILKEKCDEFVVVCKRDYMPWVMQKRNEYMVDRCNELWCFWNGAEHGGTYNCIQYALNKGKKIINLKDVD